MARDSRGFSLLELLWVVTLGVTATAIAVPQVLSGLEESRARGAARYLAGRLHRARMEAVARSKDVALRFLETEAGYAFATYVDGNRNGVLTRDIQSGTDWQLQAPERLAVQFGGVDFGTIPGLPALDSGSPPPGDDPIKLGTSNILTFTPLGTSSSGSLYVRGRQSAQYVLRVFGDTGKIRILRFDSRANRWIQQ